MKKDKKWKKPEIKILFSGNVKEHVMKNSMDDNGDGPPPPPPPG